MTPREFLLRDEPLASETTALLARMTVSPTGGRVRLINKTIRALKSAGIWERCDVLWFIAAHDAQAARLNWKGNATYDLTAVNTPTFTADRGYAGNASTSYLDTQFAPNAGVNYTQNNACFGFYINAGTATAATVVAMGVDDGTPDAWTIPHVSGGEIRTRMNDAGNSDSNTTPATRLGLTATNRTDANSTEVFRNGAGVGATVTASDGIATLSFFICGQNSGGSLALSLSNQFGLAFAGASLSAAQHVTLYSIVYDYMRALGAQHA